MKVEKTILPPAVLVSLYKDSLVLAEKEIKPVKIAENKLPGREKETISEASEMASPIKYLGDHHKKILVVVNDPASVYLNETDFILLTSILNACRLTIADIALINVGNQKASLHEMLTKLPSLLVIAFDLDSKALKIKLPTTLYKTTPLGETNLLFSAALSSMQGSSTDAKKEKGKLWSVLKQIFQL
ncbi:MAG: hypothetical protein EB092_03915 [Chitinophagia bacterium]|jgi:hypothetical protein|nr:hypothetical protein [Chitinophagia bacterium]NCA29984.1 hypothetical protein [Chitinophagia bacterium]NDD16135.1 hypothetical protein [Chitinophagia bacterium]